MSYLMALSITTGILCGLWMEISAAFGLMAWAGFAGCTSFFAAGGKKEGFKGSLVANLSGVFWAVVIIQINQHLQIPHISAISTALITFAMCIQAKCKWLHFIPGTFIGSFSTFAAGGDWKAVGIALICGACLGFLCEWTGIKLHQKWGKEA